MHLDLVVVLTCFSYLLNLFRTNNSTYYTETEKIKKYVSFFSEGSISSNLDKGKCEKYISLGSGSVGIRVASDRESVSAGGNTVLFSCEISMPDTQGFPF